MSDDGEPCWYPGRPAAECPGKVALVDAATGASRTYAELDELANRTSRLLQTLSLAPGDHVAIWFDNDLDYPALWWGAHYAGLYYTLISSRLTPGEVEYIVADSGSRVVLLGRRLHDEYGAELGRLLRDQAVLIADVDGEDGLRSRLAGASPESLPNRVEGLAMLYSSGTTGTPKAVKRPWTGAPLGTAVGAVHMAALFGIDEDAVYLSPAPLYHAAPYGYVSAVTSIGGTVVVMDHFEAEAFLATIERYQVTHTQVVPTMFVRILALPDEVRNRYDLSSLQCVVHAAAPCPRQVKEQVIAWLGPIVHEYYSGTEGVGFTYCSPEGWLAHPGSVGRPMWCEVHIVDEEGNEVPPGVDGLVYFAGLPDFEYFNDPAKTRTAYHPKGWASFGDVGHVDDKGYLYLTDRRADLVIVGGVNVYPREAENLLVSHPAVLDAAVFGVPHRDLGEQVKAVVQAVPGVATGPDLEAELITYCRSHLASLKCPRSIDFRDELPREPNGKLLKRRLRDEYRALTDPSFS